MPLALRSAELWASLAASLDDDFEYDRKGSIVVAETEAELAASAERARVLAGLGVIGEVLDADALRREEPHAAHDLPGGVLYPGDAQLEPRLATAALVRAAVRLGAELVDRHLGRPARARARRARDRRRDERGRSSARTWSSWPRACGRRRCWRPRACRFPVRPRKGQIVVLERSPVVFRRKLSRGRLRRRRRGQRRRAADRHGRRVDAERHRAARLLRQHVGFDREVELDVAGAIAARAARFFPILRNARALRVYAGLRPLTPDHVPIIGPFAEAPNVCVATGHEGAGIGLAPGHRRARRRLAHRRAVAGSARLVLPGPLRPRRARRVVSRADGRRPPLVRAPAGQSVAAALLEAGQSVLRDSPAGRPRGLYCGIGVCQECRVVVDGVVVRSCVTPVRAACA